MPVPYRILPTGFRQLARHDATGVRLSHQYPRIRSSVVLGFESAGHACAFTTTRYTLATVASQQANTKRTAFREKGQALPPKSKTPPAPHSKAPAPSSTESTTTLHARTNKASTTFTPSRGPVAVDSPEYILPAPLDLPQRDPDASTFQYYWKVMKAYVAFYKTGMQNTWANRQRVNDAPWPTHTPLTALGLYQLRSNSHTTSNPSTSSPTAATPAVDLPSYRTLLLHARHRRDFPRLPLIGILVLLTGEFTPILVWAIGSRAVPSTCVLPSLARDESYAAALRRAELLRHLCSTGPGVDAVSRVLDPAVLADEAALRDALKRLSGTQLRGVRGLLAPTGRPSIRAYLGSGAAAEDLVARVAELKADGQLLLEAGLGAEVLDGTSIAGPRDEEELVRRAVKALPEADLKRVCEERGIDVVHKAKKDVEGMVLRQKLGQWLGGVVLGWQQERLDQWQL